MYLSHLTPTVWGILALATIGVEIFFPVAVFLWIGVAAAIITALSHFLHITPTVQILIFVVLAPLITMIGRYLVPVKLKNSHEKNINRRLDQMIGLEIVLSEDLVQGCGQAKVADSVWLVRANESLTAGTLIKVYGIDGNTLLVRLAKPLS